MKQNSRIQLENTLIGALGVLSLVLFILSFLPGLGLANRVGILLEMGHMVQRAFSSCSSSCPSSFGNGSAPPGTLLFSCCF